MASTTTPEKNKRLARRFPEEVATAGEIDRIDEICTADVIEHSPLGVLRGREELKEQSRYIHAAFPDVSVAIEDEVAEDALVAQRLTFRGTHEGEFMGVEPTGNEVEIANMLFTRIENRHIAARWLLPDMLGLLQQLGVVEPSTGTPRPQNRQTTGNERGTTGTPTKVTTTSAENKRIVRRLPEEAANEGDLDVIDEIFAEDFVDHTPLGDLKGRGALRDQFQQIFAAFPDRTVTVEHLVAEGNTAAVRVTWHATHEGVYMGIQPTGRKVEFTSTEFHRLEEGEIAERWILPDQLGLMQQLGLVEPPTG